MSFLKVAFLAARWVKGGALFSISNAMFLATSLVMALIPNLQLIHSHYDELGAVFIAMDLISLSCSWARASDTSPTSFILACIVVGLAQPLVLHIRFKFIVAAALCYLLSIGPLLAIPFYDSRWFIICGLIFVGLQSSSIQELTAMQLCKERVKLEREERRTGSLLAKMLPPVASHRLKAGEKHIASEHKEVTILFAEIEGISEFVKTDEVRPTCAPWMRPCTNVFHSPSLSFIFYPSPKPEILKPKPSSSSSSTSSRKQTPIPLLTCPATSALLVKPPERISVCRVVATIAGKEPRRPWCCSTTCTSTLTS